MQLNKYFKPALVLACLIALAWFFVVGFQTGVMRHFVAMPITDTSAEQEPDRAVSGLKLSTHLSAPTSQTFPTAPSRSLFVPLFLLIFAMGGTLLIKRLYDHLFTDVSDSDSNRWRLNTTHVESPPEPGEDETDVGAQLELDVVRQQEHIDALKKRVSALQAQLVQVPSPLKDNTATATTTDPVVAELIRKNASDKELIRALEELVKENREKWLQRDTTESIMKQRINELSDNLNAAMAIIRDHHIEDKSGDNEVDADAHPKSQSASS